MLGLSFRNPICCDERNGGEGGILTQSLSPSYHFFGNLHENGMKIGDSPFSHLSTNSIQPFALSFRHKQTPKTPNITAA